MFKVNISSVSGNGINYTVIGTAYRNENDGPITGEQRFFNQGKTYYADLLSKSPNGPVVFACTWDIIDHIRIAYIDALQGYVYRAPVAGETITVSDTAAMVAPPTVIIEGTVNAASCTVNGVPQTLPAQVLVKDGDTLELSSSYDVLVTSNRIIPVVINGVSQQCGQDPVRFDVVGDVSGAIKSPEPHNITINYTGTQVPVIKE